LRPAARCRVWVIDLDGTIVIAHSDKQQGTPTYKHTYVWQVNGVARSKLLDNGNGFEYLPERVGLDQLELIRTDVAASR
jgi:hypothetical protein